MPIVEEDKHPDLHRYLHDRNLLRQYDLLSSLIKIGVDTGKGGAVFDRGIISQLNYEAMANIHETAGRFREIPIYIRPPSKHLPPPAAEVTKLVDGLIAQVHIWWNRAGAVRLAAFALWYLNWIHPYCEGNGRTARAVAYYLLCVKSGGELPGNYPLPKLIRDTRPRYCEALGRLDESYAHHKSFDQMDFTPMLQYLNELVTKQVQS